MIREIDRIMNVRENLDNNGKIKIDKALASISDFFKEFVSSTTSIVLGENNKKLDFSEALEALKVLRELVGEEIPAVDNEQDALLYIVKFGKDIVLS